MVKLLLAESNRQAASRYSFKCTVGVFQRVLMRVEMAAIVREVLRVAPSTRLARSKAVLSL